MNLKKSAYSILIVSTTDSFTSAFTDLFPKSKHSSTHTVNSISAAKQMIAEKSFDFVIINSPLPDDSGVHFAIDICTTEHTIVLILMKEDLYKIMRDKLVPYGIFTLPKPIPRATLFQAFHCMESARERLRYLEEKSLSMEEKLLELRLVNRAKWILIHKQQMQEPEAHRYIEKQAMDCCLSKKHIAETIIKNYA